MKRREFITAGAVTVATTTISQAQQATPPAPETTPAPAVASPAVVNAMPEIRWRLTSGFPKSLDTIYGASDLFAKYVSEATDGRFQVQPFAAGEIVGTPQAIDAVSNNTVEMAHTASYYYVGKDPTFGILTAAPFGLNTRHQNSWFYHNGGLELANEFYGKIGLYALPGGNTGTQMGGWFRKEIKTVDDMKGLKMRIAGIAGNVMQKLGVIPQQIPRRRHLSCPRARYDRRGRVGRALRRREARLQQGCPVLLLPRMVGRRRDDQVLVPTRRSSPRSRRATGRSSRRLRPMPTST